jgi:two-component system, cell cycle sensor histidine kinase and response regulator CckA
MKLLRIEDHEHESQRASSGFAQAPYGVATTDAHCVILAVNDRLAEMLGFDSRELVGQRLSDFANPNVWNVTRSPIYGETRIVEQIVWVFQDHAGPRPVPAPDLGEHRKRDAQLEQADRLTSLGRMAATIAHDFNNVLMGISPFVEVIRRGKSVDTSLDHIGRAVKRGKRITEEILRFTRSSQPQVAPFTVEPWIENIAHEARSLVPSNCRIETFVQSSGFAIDGDADQLHEVFTSLILNARDAMPHGGTLSIEVLRERPNSRLPFGYLEHPERFAHCIVRDTGCGMSAETLRHIYEPLFTTKRSGTGLGLSVAHQVVQRHGGAIFAESTVGAGTAFHIFLPLATKAVLSTEKLSAIVQDVMASYPRHVLLVEDDPSVAAGLVSLLELEGLVVDVVETGAAAIRAVEQFRPDLVVLDVGLPDMEGTNVYEAIAAKMPTLPVIFSTGHADRARLDDYLEQPHVGFLLKPYERSMLLRAIEDVLPS